MLQKHTIYSYTREYLCKNKDMELCEHSEENTSFAFW